MKLDELRALGVNVEEGMERCLNNEDFYLKMVGKCLEDPKFEQLGEAIKDPDLDEAFELAHALKGVVSNLSLTPLQDIVSEITELLRARKQMDYSELYAKMMQCKGAFDALV